MTTTRLRTVLVAAAPTARVAHLGPATLTASLALAPILVTLARGGTDLGTPLIVAGLASGAALGWATEDPAADVLASMPVSNPIRAALRLVFVTTVAVGGLTAGALAMALGPGVPMDRADRVPEALAAGAIALAIGFVLARRGERGAGPASVTGGFVGTAFVGGLALRWPDLFPAFFAGPIHDRWWIIAIVAAIVAMRAGRDPAALADSEPLGVSGATEGSERVERPGRSKEKAMTPALFLRRGVAVVAPLALLIAACGDDDDAATTSEDTVSVSFTAPEDGDSFAGAVPFTMTAEGLTIEPAGEVHADAGHFHLIADDGCVDVGEPVAKDADHLHFGKAQTEGKIYLEPGTHELCLQPGDGVHAALAPTDTLTVEVGITSREELCSVIKDADVLFEEADTGGAEFADRKVMYENIRRLFVQLEDGLEHVDADVRDSVAQSFTFGSSIATAFAEAADEAGAMAAIEAIYGTEGVQSGADSPWAQGSAWVLEECGVDIDGED